MKASVGIYGIVMCGLFHELFLMDASAQFLSHSLRYLLVNKRASQIKINGINMLTDKVPFEMNWIIVS